MTRDILSLGVWALLAFALTLCNQFIGAVVPLPSYTSFAGHLLAILYLAALLLALMETAQSAARLPQQSASFLLIAGVLLAFPMGTVLLLRSQKLFPPLWLFLTANNLFLPIAAALVGAGIGRVIRHPNTLLAGAGFAIFFDIVVVTMGTVAQLMKSGSNLIASVSVGAGSSLPAAGSAAATMLRPVKQHPILSGVTIGPADVLFLALFLSAVALLRLSRRATFAWMYLLLVTALVIVETTGLPIPALAPMGIAVLIANARHAAFTRSEKYALGYGSVFAVICAALIIVGAQRLVPTPPPRFGFALGRATPTGPFIITGIVPGSTAEKAGLRPGDGIFAIDGALSSGITPERLDELLLQGRRSGMTLRIRRRGEAASRDISLKPPPRGG